MSLWVKFPILGASLKETLFYVGILNTVQRAKKKKKVVIKTSSLIKE